jgi:DNA (cytosine-5)-methyltransferase 1
VKASIDVPISNMTEAGTSIDTEKALTCGGFFAGIGGFCVGFEDLGFKTNWALDWSEDARNTYTHNFPLVNYLLSDITKVKAKNLEPVDVLHAGFPCQSFSGAGLKMGFEDPRGQLFFEIPRLLKEWGVARPKVVVLENSPFLKIGGAGTWFKTVITEIQRAGYWFNDRNCFELDAREHGGLPQRRKRLFMVAVRNDVFDFNGIRLDKVIPATSKTLEEIVIREDVGDHYYLPSENRYNKMISKQVMDDDPYQLYQLRKYFVRVPESGVCPTLTANMGQGGHNVPFLFHKQRIRKLTEMECLGLQGFPIGFEFPMDLPTSRRYVLVGNAVSPAVSKVIAERVKEFLQGSNENE